MADILRRLEIASAHPNIDVRLSAEIAGMVRFKTSELGLDPNDTTPAELYHSLQHLVGKHDNFLKQIVRNDNNGNFDLKALKDSVDNLGLPKSCWSLKSSSAKKLLKALPPTRAMKQLGYKSADSMIKREPVINIYIASQLLQPPIWHDKFLRQYKTLKPSDFERKDATILAIEDARLDSAIASFVRHQRHNLLSIKELALIVLLPLPNNNIPGVHLTVFSSLVAAINELRTYSAYLKLQQVKPNFGLVVSRTLLGKAQTGLKIAGQQLPWRLVQQYLSRLETVFHPDIFGPHLQPEDVIWQSPADVLFKLEPALKFWEDLDYVAASGSSPVPFNLFDNALSYSNNLHFGKHSTGQFQTSLLSEIYLRYLLETPLGEKALNKLDDLLIGGRAQLFAEAGV